MPEILHQEKDEELINVDMGGNQTMRITRSRSRTLESKDMISSLPDEVLGRILSFLHTKHAVATTILSSRWKNLYKLTSTLDFDDMDYLISRVDLGIKKGNSDTCFMEFVKTIVARCKTSHISKFRLKCEHNFKLSLLRECMDAAEYHKVAELELSVKMSTISCLLKLSRLTCENLVVLKLDGAFTLCVAKSVTFPRLKLLFLKGITFNDESVIDLIAWEKRVMDHHHTLNGILFGCPVLEELVLDGCTWHGGDLYFTNPLLRSLTLHNGLCRILDELAQATIYIDLPSLVYFKYSDGLAEEYEIKNLNSVTEAHIDICFSEDYFEDQQDLCNVIIDLITGICNCRFLDLSGPCLEALTSGDFELPIFRNLTRLDLALGVYVCWNDVLLDFLISSPSLEYLTLKQGGMRPDFNQQDRKFSFSNVAVPACVKSQLKFINIKHFIGFKGEVKLVKCFLENAHVLKEMVIQWDQNHRIRDFCATEKLILKLPKSSLTCSISFQ